MSKKREVKISCIGISFIEPILALYLKLKTFKFSGKSKTQVSSRENGYAVSIIVLSILLVESVLNRVRYLKKSKQNNLIFFSSKFNNPQLATKLYELYILRDLIVHNHIWRISYEFDNDFNEVRIYQKLLDGYGDKKPDKKYVNYVNKRQKRTKKLKLNINPIKVNTLDVIKVFKVLKELFEFLEMKNRAYFPLSNFHFKYNNKFLTFYEIMSEIIN